MKIYHLSSERATGRAADSRMSTSQSKGIQGSSASGVGLGSHAQIESLSFDWIIPSSERYRVGRYDLYLASLQSAY